MNRVNLPIVLYDDQCHICLRFAKLVNCLARGRLTLIGHYTNLGRRIRDSVLDSSATDMFWVVNKDVAYGGRAALLPLLLAIITTRNGQGLVDRPNICAESCKVLVRSASLLLRSRRIRYERVDGM